MNTLLRCIQIVLLAMLWPSLSLASPGSGEDGDRDRESHRDGDSSESRSDGDRDDDNSGPESDGDRDDDSSGPGSDGDRDDDSSGSESDGDRDDDGDSGPGDGGDPDHGDDDNSGEAMRPGGDGDGEDNDTGSGSAGAQTDERSALEIEHAVQQHLDSPFEISRDDEGREYVRDEALMRCAPADLAAALASGFELISQRTMASDGAVVARLLTPAGMSVDDAVAALRSIAPEALVSRNTIFRGAQAVSVAAIRPARRSQTQTRGVLGIIDTGADTNFLRRGAVVATRAFAAPTYTPRQHGSLVASIAAASGVRVQIADVFDRASDGGIAASADAIVAALDWMLETGVPVINVSIEGPENPLLTDMVRTAAQRGHIVIAAAGNGGPRAAPVFPAALEGAVAVTAVDDTGHAYRRANRGDYIAFAARGVDIEVDLGGDVVSVSGTSFAAPFVAARLASHYHHASPMQARAALDAMRANAIDLGRPGRDPVFGWGLVSD